MTTPLPTKKQKFTSSMQQAVGLHQAGELREAEKIYKKCLKIHPNHPETLHLMGVLAGQKGKTEEAIRLIERAIAANPKSATYHGNLGKIYQDTYQATHALNHYRQAVALAPENMEYRQALAGMCLVVKDYASAEENYRFILERHPRDLLALLGLGSLQLQAKMLKEAEETFTILLGLDPTHAEAHRSMGYIHYRRLDVKKAEAYYRKALELDPTLVRAMVNLGAILHGRGEKTEARSLIEKAIELMPNSGAAWFSLSNLKKFNDPDDPNLHHMCETLKTAQPEEAAYIHYALGKAFHDLKNYDEAFSHYKKGSDIKKQKYTYIPIAEKKGAELTAAHYPRTFFEEREGWGNPDTAPIFILGMPRSGTTLVEQILASHPQVTGAGELPYLSEIAVGSPPELTGKSYPGGLLNLSRERCTELGHLYMEKVAWLKGDSPFVTDKMPANFHHIGLIKLILPNAKIIHCRRNPLDTCLSCYRQLFTEGQIFRYDLNWLADYYLCYLEFMAHWHSALPGWIYDIDYEHLVAEQEAESKKLLKFCGLGWDKQCLEFHKSSRPVLTASAGQVHQPVYKSSLEGWRKYEKGLAPVIRRFEEAGIL